MDAFQKRVVRWKRHVLVNVMQLKHDVIEELTAKGLLTEKMLKQIQAEPSQFAQTVKYLELLPTTPVPAGADTFTEFCSWLDGRHPGIGDELRVELSAERGELTVQDTIRQDASHALLRSFGGTKRFSQREKRIIESLIATRAQCAQEAWKQTVTMTRGQLHEQVALSTRLVRGAEDLTVGINEFSSTQRRLHGLPTMFGVAVKGNEFNPSSLAVPRAPHSTHSAVSLMRTIRFPQLVNEVGHSSQTVEGAASKDIAVGDSSSTTKWSSEDLTRMTAAGDAALANLAASIENLKFLTTSCLAEREQLKAEKQRVLRLIGVEDGPSLPLDNEVERSIRRIREELTNTKNQATDGEQKAKLLEDQMRSMRHDYERNLEDKRQTLMETTIELEATRGEMFTVKDDLRQVMEQLRLVMSELSNYKVKSKFLEKSRHLGYIFDKYSLMLNDDNLNTDEKVSRAAVKSKPDSTADTSVENGGPYSTSGVTNTTGLYLVSKKPTKNGVGVGSGAGKSNGVKLPLIAK